MDIAILTAKLAEIREKIISLVEQINLAGGGEPFYARIFLTADGQPNDDQRIVGLFSDLRVEKYEIVFTLTEERLLDGGEVKQEISQQAIELEKIRGIDVFKTASGKPMFISNK